MRFRLKRVLFGAATISLAAAALVPLGAGSAEATPGAQPTPTIAPFPVATRTTTFSFPGGITCDGTGASGWRAHTFIVNKSVDPSTLDFSVSGAPAGFVGIDFDSTDGTIAAPLFKGSEEAGANFLPATSPAGFVAAPNFSGFTFDPSVWTLTDGTYRIGFACVDGPGVVKQWWSRLVSVDADGSPNPFLTVPGDLAVTKIGGKVKPTVALMKFTGQLTNASTSTRTVTEADVEVHVSVDGDPVSNAGVLVTPVTKTLKAGKPATVKFSWAPGDIELLPGQHVEVSLCAPSGDPNPANDCLSAEHGAEPVDVVATLTDPKIKKTQTVNPVKVTVTNVGTGVLAPLKATHVTVTATVDSVEVGTFTQPANPTKGKSVKPTKAAAYTFKWNHTALPLGTSVSFHACVDVENDVSPTNNCATTVVVVS